MKSQPVKSFAPLIPPQAHLIPHPDKELSEDAYVISPEGTLLGVADGVGSWSNVGVNTADYSTSILKNTEEYLQHNPNAHLAEAVAHAYDKNQQNDIPGSTTLCLVHLKGRELHALNLGDSGFMIIRNGKIICRTKDQHHSFNYPYQLGKGGDTLDKAHVWHSVLQMGDMIVMGSDGFFDNLHPEEILDVIAKSPSDKIAWNLGFAAFVASCSEQRSTPFAERVAMETEEIWPGGKKDDITVLVTVVK